MSSLHTSSRQTVASSIDLEQIFAASRSALCILRGPEHRWEKVNRVYQELIFPGVVLIGRAVHEVIPDVHEQGFGMLLDQVYATGQASEGIEVRLQVPDRPPMYFNFVYAPIHDVNGAISGIFVEAHDVTAQVVVRQALEAAEANYRGIVEHAAEGIFRTAPDGTLLLVNPSLARIFGYASPQEMREQLTTGAEHLYADPARRAELLRLLAQQDIVTGFVIKARRKDGTFIWLSLSARVVRTGDGSVWELEGIAEDITERQRAEEALRQSEARYRTLFEHFPNGAVFLFDHDLRYTLASGSSFAEGGVVPAVFEGKTLWEIFPPEIASRDEPYLRAALRGETSRVEVPFAGKTHLVQTVPVKDEAGTIVGGMVMTQDITDRKRAEEQRTFLAEASAILGASLDTGATLQSVARLAVPLVAEVCAIFIVGAEGVVQPVAVAHVDSDTERHLREHLHDLALAPTAVHPVVSVIRTAQPEITSASHDGAARSNAQGADRATVASALVPPAHVILPLTVREQVLGAMLFGWRDPDREPLPVEVQLAGELTRRVAQAVEHARLYREAQQALRARDEFLSIAAHELKTPLTILRGSAEILQRRATRTQSSTITDRDQRTLGVIVQQSERLQQQIDTLLDLSQIGANRLSLELRSLDVCSFVERIVDEIQPTLERHQVVLRCESPSLLVQGDAGRLEQVLQNLLQNAVKYSPQGGTVTVHVALQQSEVAIAVIDQGIGIPAEAQAQLFERFYRVRTAVSQGISGLGIGLAVVADIVERHGGRVDVASVEGEGSTFTVLLPEYRDEREPNPTAVGS